MTPVEVTKYETFAIQLARQLYHEAGLSPSWANDDAHDLCVDLILAPRHPWDDIADPDHRRALILTCIRRRLANKRRKRLTYGSRVMTWAISVDRAPFGTFDENGNEENIESALIQDDGRQAEAIRSYDESEPEYVAMTRKEVDRILSDARHNDERRVCRALQTTLTRTAAKRKSRVSVRRFRYIMKKFQVRFAQCLRAYHAYLESRRRTDF